jgi:hypothetical protein
MRYENAFTFGAVSGHGFQPCRTRKAKFDGFSRWCPVSGAKALLLNAFFAAWLKPLKPCPDTIRTPPASGWRRNKSTHYL